MNIKSTILLGLLTAGSLGAMAQIEAPVKWSYGAKKTSAHTCTVYIKADLAKGWHIYSTRQPAGGPQKTLVTFKRDPGYSLMGPVAEPQPLVKNEPVFEMDVRYFEGAVVFTQKLKLKTGLALVKGAVKFMAYQCQVPAAGRGRF